MTVTIVQISPLIYQPNYKSNRNPQSNRFSNWLMFVQRGKTGYSGDDRKEKENIPRRNLDQITCKDYGGKGHYSGNIDYPTQSNLKDYAEAFRKMNQEISSNNPPGGGY